MKILDMEKEVDIAYIAVKDKQAVIEVAEILEKYGINVFSSKEKKQNFVENGLDFNNHFLVKDQTGPGWRAQSHYLGSGVQVGEIEYLIKSGKAKFRGEDFNVTKEQIRISSLTDEEILEEEGWTITCQSPHEIEHEDGSCARGRATQYVIDAIVENFKLENS